MIMQEDDQMDLGNINDDRYTQEPLYIQKLKTISETEEFTLDVDCEHVYRFNPQLYKQLEDYPTDVIPIFDLVALNVYNEFVKCNQGDNGMNDGNFGGNQEE